MGSWELGSLTNLQILNLSGNHLIGSLAPELANLGRLDELNLRSNRLTGTVPRDFWKRASRRELLLRYRDNEILGFGPSSSPSQGPRAAARHGELNAAAAGLGARVVTAFDRDGRGMAPGVDQP